MELLADKLSQEIAIMYVSFQYFLWYTGPYQWISTALDNCLWASNLGILLSYTAKMQNFQSQSKCWFKRTKTLIKFAQNLSRKMVSLQTSNFKIHWSSLTNARPGVNFINILSKAFVCTEPKSVKRYWQLDWILMLLGATRVKADQRKLMKLTPAWLLVLSSFHSLVWSRKKQMACSYFLSIFAKST